MNDRKSPLHDFIQRDPNAENTFFCNHPEIEGSFVIHDPSIGRDMELERRKGDLCGATPTPNGEDLAEVLAATAVGFKSSPDGFNLVEVSDMRVGQALYREVASYWGMFRSQIEAPSF